MSLAIESEAIRFERYRRTVRNLTVGTLGTLAVSGALVIGGIAVSWAWLITLGMCGVFVGLGLGVAAVINRLFIRPQPKPVAEARPGTVNIDGDGLRVAIDGSETRRIAKADVKLGWTDAEGGAVLELHGGERLVIAGLADEERHALLRALDTTSSERVMETTIAGAYQSHSHQGCLRALMAAAIPLIAMGVVTGPCALIAVVVMAVQQLVAGNLASGALTLALVAAAVGVLATAAVGMVRFYRRRQVHVGTDGVRIGGVWSSQFIPYGEVAEVRSEAGQVVIIDDQRREHPLRDADPALAIRVREAMEAQQQQRTTGVRVELLDQGERDEQTWQSDLAELTRGTERYRDRGLDPQQLVEVVEDAACPPRRRVAAAYALSHSEAQPLHRRIRVAAEASADDALREALELAAEGELSERKLRRCHGA